MGTVLTHPFLCLNRYKQNDRTTYIICYHGAPDSFTNKPEIGGLGADETCYFQYNCKHFIELIYCVFVINMVQYMCCMIMLAGRTRYANYAISLSMIRNDGRSINKAVGSARQFFTAESVIAWLCYLRYDKSVP